MLLCFPKSQNNTAPTSFSSLSSSSSSSDSIHKMSRNQVEFKTQQKIHTHHSSNNQSFLKEPASLHLASLTSSVIQPRSGSTALVGYGSTRSREFSLLSLSNIFARKSLPDSTLSITGSSSSSSQQVLKISGYPMPGRVGVRVGVEGRLQNPGRSIDPRGDPYPGEPPTPPT